MIYTIDLDSQKATEFSSYRQDLNLHKMLSSQKTKTHREARENLGDLLGFWEEIMDLICCSYRLLL